MAAPRSLLALLVASSVALGACGQSTKDSAKDFQGEQKAVAQTVEDLQKAGAKRDAGKICDQLLAPALVAKIRQTSSGGTCDRILRTALDDADAFEVQAKKVTLAGDTANVVVESSSGKDKRTDTLTLQKIGGQWRVSSLGTRPAG